MEIVRPSSLTTKTDDSKFYNENNSAITISEEKTTQNSFIEALSGKNLIRELIIILNANITGLSRVPAHCKHTYSGPGL